MCFVGYGQFVNCSAFKPEIIIPDMNRYFEEDKQATAEMGSKPEPDTVILAWASRKRHIFVNGVLLFAKQHKSNGYSPKGRHYVSYQLEMPSWPMTHPDTKHTHTVRRCPFRARCTGKHG